MLVAAGLPAPRPSNSSRSLAHKSASVYSRATQDPIAVPQALVEANRNGWYPISIRPADCTSMMS
jgi:hypothetical protein